MKMQRQLFRSLKKWSTAFRSDTRSRLLSVIPTVCNSPSRCSCDYRLAFQRYLMEMHPLNVECQRQWLKRETSVMSNSLLCSLFRDDLIRLGFIAHTVFQKDKNKKERKEGEQTSRNKKLEEKIQKEIERSKEQIETRWANKKDRKNPSFCWWLTIAT